MVAWRRCPANPSAGLRQVLDPGDPPPRPVGPAPSAESDGAPTPCESVRGPAPGSPHPAPRAGGASTTPSSTVLGSCSNRARRGCTWGGASRAATNSSHCSGSSWKLCRSASVSAALARALSSTKSVTLRCAAAAAAAARCRVCIAPGVSRRSSFSLRKGMAS